MSYEEINALLPTFTEVLKEHRYNLRPNRIRKVGGGRKGDLPTDEDKNFYILIYLKVYMTYDVLSVMTNHQRSKCCDTVKLLLPVMETVLRRKLVLPNCNKLPNMDDRMSVIPFSNNLHPICHRKF